MTNLSPASLAPLDGLDVCARSHSEHSGGDVFDALAVESRLIFLLTDIAGLKSGAQGIAAEMQTFRRTAHNLFAPAVANESEAIAALTHEVNRALIEAAGGVRMAPTFLGCFNLALGVMTYCNAGQGVAIFGDAESTHLLERGGVPLGLFTHVTYEPAVQVFQPGDRLLLVTKGMLQAGAGDSDFGIPRLEQLVQQSNGDSAAGICDKVLREAFEFSNSSGARHHAQDDLTAVAMVRKKTGLARK